MKNNLELQKNLNNHGFSKIQIEEIFNYLLTLEYDLERTQYVGISLAKNERLAKYFFLRDKLKFETLSLAQISHINSILDQCIDWSEFWRLLVIKKGFCCIKLAGLKNHKRQYVFLYGPNMLSGPNPDMSNSIYED